MIGFALSVALSKLPMRKKLMEDQYRGFGVWGCSGTEKGRPVGGPSLGGVLVPGSSN